MCADGKALAKDCSCKYTEVSAILDHRVDELLVGTIRQVRLRHAGLTAADSSDSGSETVPNPTGGEQPSLGCFQRLLLFFFPKKTPAENCDDLFAP